MERTKSGVPGFDEIIGGGFPKGTCCLITGTAGSGKTTFAVQFLYKGVIDNGENGVYVSLEERPKDLRREMLNFGWDLKKMEDQKTLAIIDICSARESIKTTEQYSLRNMGARLNISALSAHIFEVCKEVKAKRIVIDSIPSLQLRLRDESEVRRATSLLSNLLLEMERTSLLITEIADSHEFSRYGFEEYVTRGVVVMRLIPQYGELKRTVQVMKMRGTCHSTRTYPMEICSKGILVHSQGNHSKK
jgi:KaiC/GvpD/RAD55 family RecA-like ATPase